MKIRDEGLVKNKAVYLAIGYTCSGYNQILGMWIEQSEGVHDEFVATAKLQIKPASFNLLQQQERFDDFKEIYNNDRPHQALSMEYPVELYTLSPRVFHPPEPLEYPFHDRTTRVTRCGRLCFDRRKISLS